MHKKAVKSCADDSFRNYKLRMSKREAAEIIKVERECVERNTSNKCDRDCTNCDLLRTDEEIFSAYDMAIEALQEPERKRGRWIEYENEYGEKLHYCSECKNDAHRHYSEYRNDVVELLFDYCQHCGSDMRGESE